MELEIIGVARSAAFSILVLPTVATLICAFVILGVHMTKMYRASR